MSEHDERGNWCLPIDDSHEYGAFPDFHFNQLPMIVSGTQTTFPSPLFGIFLPKILYELLNFGKFQLKCVFN